MFTRQLNSLSWRVLSCLAALGTLPILIGIASAQNTDSNSVDTYYAAVAALNAKDCQEALNYLNQIAGTFRDDPKYILSYAQAEECLGNKEAALAWYRHYADLAPGIQEIQTKIGELVYQLKKERDAKAVQQKAIENKKRLDAAAAAEKAAHEAQVRADLKTCLDQCDSDKDTCQESDADFYNCMSDGPDPDLDHGSEARQRNRCQRFVTDWPWGYSGNDPCGHTAQVCKEVCPMVANPGGR